MVLLMYVEEGFYSKPSCDLSRVGVTTLLGQVSMTTLFLLPHICIAYLPPCFAFIPQRLLWGLIC